MKSIKNTFCNPKRIYIDGAPTKPRRSHSYCKIDWKLLSFQPKTGIQFHPGKIWLLAKKNTFLPLPMTPLFHCRILVYSKNGDVCKKLELNTLRFDRDMRVLKKIQNFRFFTLWTENTINQRVFKIFPEFFFYMVSNYPLSLYMSQH